MKLIRKPLNEEKESTTFKNIFRLIPYWKMFAGLVLFSVVCAWLYLSTTTPVYEVNAKILIKDDKTDDQDSKKFESLDIISPKRSIDNELEVIESKDLIIKVVNNLHLYAPIFEKGTLRNTLAYNSSPIIVSTNDITNIKSADKVAFVYQNSNVIINEVKYPLNKLVSTPYGNLRFDVNPRFKAGTYGGNTLFFQLISPQKIVRSLADNLTVNSANKLSTIIALSLHDENQDRGEDILNNVIKEYNLSIVEEKNVLAANTERFIKERLTKVENNLLQIERKQQAYQANKGAIDIGTQGKLYLESVSNNDQKVSEINTQLSVLTQIERSVKSRNLASGIVPSTVGVNDPGLTEMVKNIYELQLDVESLKKTTGVNNPLVIANQQKIESIRPQILQNLQNQRQSLLASRNNLSSTNQGYSSQLQSMPETQKNLVDINRELNIESGVYTFLLQKKEETALSFIANDQGGKIVEKAAASEFPVSPKRKIILFAALLGALLIGFVIAQIRESLRKNIMYQADIEKLTILPVISEITSGEGNKPVVIGENQRTLIAEQFRRLRTTLKSLGIGGLKKRILITSAISGEGKSFVALNLAISLALTNKKVVLVDYDLNNPSLHTKLKLKKEEGVTDFLEGKASVDAIINQTTINPNLSFISAGNLSDLSSELITNELTEELLIHLDTIYDYVIIDVAPIGPISDAYILSPLCDATLFVVRHAFTPKAFIERIDKNNELNSLNNAAIVFNDVSSRNFGNYGYGYGYGYVYGNKAKEISSI